ncbi:hypothetical protein ALI144C_05115 [Actinosynnema sp. ALI-1.44]|nr:hypothetical protein ALI144C_05115 [Actinosynnema sp. ALI-1.44]
MTKVWVRLFLAIVENVGVPVGAYLLFTMLGWQPVWALVGAAGVSVLVLAAQYLRRHELTVLGGLVLARFALGVPVALVTGDARVELAKDFVITGAIGLFAAVSLLARRPLIARIRRDLAADPAQFDRRWREDAGFHALHRRLTLVWTIGLSAEAVVAILLIYTLPLTLAVVTASIIAPATLLTLIAATEWLARRYTTTHHELGGQLKQLGSH